MGGGWNQFTGNVDPKAVATVDVMLADIPVEGEKNVFLDENADAAMAAHEGVEVIVSQVRALPARAYEFTGMTLAVNGRRYALPFDAVASDDRIFLRDGYWTLRDGKGELKQKVKTSDTISLKAGANALALVADAIEGELRADVTLLAFGEKFPALKPTDKWPKKWAKHGMYEAMQPIEFCPRKGASELPNLTIRPGERAEIEVHLVGDAKSPWLEYASKDGMKRISLPDGHAGKRVKFKGPVLSGVRPLRFGCANSDSADVRIEIVKHYTDRPADAEPPAAPVAASAVDVAVPGTVAGDVKVSVPEPGGWKVSATQKTADGVSVVTVQMSSPQAARPPKFTVSFARPGIGADHVWTPYDDRYMIRPHEWGATPYESQLAFRAPIAAAYRVNGENVLSLACSEAFDALKYGLTVGSSDCRLHGDVAFFTEYAAPRKTYEAKIRIDTRKVRWSQGVSDAADWISRTAGLEPCRVPEAARDPMYSTWYAFWQDVKADVLEREAPLAASLGMKAMILDDGWQKEKSRTYYSATGDWMPVEGRFPDMKAHVEKVHAAGLKYILWLSVPFVGDESAAYGRFKGKFLCEADEGSGTYVLDVRFPEVREYLIATYERAVRDWGFDGLKLDFIDMLKIPASGDPAEKDGWKGRDIRSLPVAVDTLMKDVRRRLTAINPDVLIEFRQQYMGPAIRQYGNMIRATDCPADSDKIRKLVCDLRLTSGTTAVHSDMLVWHPGETPERAARPILNALFSTIQYSMVLARLPAAHHEVIRHWLAFTQVHRATLLDGAFLPEHPEALYPLVAAESATERIAAAYTSGTVVPALAGGKTTWAINATDAAGLVVDAAEAGAAEIFDTFGKPCGKAAFGKGLVRLAVPPSGYCTCYK